MHVTRDAPAVQTMRSADAPQLKRARLDLAGGSDFPREISVAELDEKRKSWSLDHVRNWKRPPKRRVDDMDDTVAPLAKHARVDPGTTLGIA